MSFKKTKVVMLPTNEKATVGSIVTRPSDNRMATVNVLTINDPQPCVHQHLYFLSDEEIKEGDWFVMNGSIIRQCKSTNKEPYTIHTVVDTTGGIHHVSVCEKVIATTDKLLRLPQPSQSFIEKFVEEYNKGNVITEVLVEYEEIKVLKQTLNEGFGSYYHKAESEFVLKVNPKDNTIAIRKVNLKGEHIINFVNDFIKEFPEQNLEYLKLRAESWIEENL